MKRTQQEILERFESADDWFGTQQGDLVAYMDFETAKPHLVTDFVEKVLSGEEKWEVSTNPKKEIVDYIPFAFEKAYNERGLSAGRSMLHMKTWIWLDDPEFYKEIEDELDNYHNYGLPQLIKICKHYSIEIPAE